VHVDKDAGYLMVCETVPRNYFFIFFSPRSQDFFFHSLIAQTAVCISIRRK
jgi:hypothetical protein